MFDFLQALYNGSGSAHKNRLKVYDMSSGSYLANTEADFCNKLIEEGEKYKEKRLKDKIKAIETMEAETDPKIKRRMQIYIEDGNYDFSNIRDF